MPASFRRNAVGVAILSLSCCASSWAQSQVQAAEPGAAMREITVTGNPLGASDLIAPTTTLSHDALLLRSEPSLGETLNGLPGVSSTYFGPNASRPTIRGQDGDRIRILQNGGATADASALSYDHAVPVDPLVIDRVEVLRGPSALQYGGSAVGGVVNLLDNRIPTEPIEGVGGRADVGYATGNREKSGGVVVEAGNGRVAVHADAFRRESDDVSVPIDLACDNPQRPGEARKICNSSSEAEGGAFGGTLFFDQGWIGASASTYRSTYGSVAEDDVSIRMKSDRYALEGEWRPGGIVSSVHMKASRTNYGHTEFEGPEPGTVFARDTNDLRIEARHQKWGNLEGLIGFSSESGDFSAEGEEAFVPESRSRTNALFLHEELGTSWGRLSFGARTEDVNVRSNGSSDPEIDRFVVGERNFRPNSAALGALVNLNSQWQLTSNLAYTERAPKDYELFANGPHVATGAWETGDAELKKEKSTGVDLGTQWTSGPNNARVNAYYTRFSNYIGLLATGNTRGEEGELNPEVGEDGEEALPEYAYSGVRARFVGIEANGTLRLLGNEGLAQPEDPSTLDLEWRGDLIRATNTDLDQPLPRIAPVRVGATLAYGSGPWKARLGFDYYGAQDRVPEGDQATDAYTLWNASLTYKMRVQRANLTWYARIDNITNELAYSSTSILTTTAYPNVPLPGRSLKVGLRATF